MVFFKQYSISVTCIVIAVWAMPASAEMNEELSRHACEVILSFCGFENYIDEEMSAEIQNYNYTKNISALINVNFYSKQSDEYAQRKAAENFHQNMAAFVKNSGKNMVTFATFVENTGKNMMTFVDKTRKNMATFMRNITGNTNDEAYSHLNKPVESKMYDAAENNMATFRAKIYENMTTFVENTGNMNDADKRNFRENMVTFLKNTSNNVVTLTTFIEKSVNDAGNINEEVFRENMVTFLENISKNMVTFVENTGKVMVSSVKNTSSNTKERTENFHQIMASFVENTGIYSNINEAAEKNCPKPKRNINEADEADEADEAGNINEAELIYHTAWNLSYNYKDFYRRKNLYEIVKNNPKRPVTFFCDENMKDSNKEFIKKLFEC